MSQILEKDFEHSETNMPNRGQVFKALLESEKELSEKLDLIKTTGKSINVPSYFNTQYENIHDSTFNTRKSNNLNVGNKYLLSPKY